MGSLYKFISRKFKILAVFLILVGVQSYLIYTTQLDQFIYSQSLEKMPIHFQIASALGNDLMDKCKYRGPDFMDKLKRFAQNNGVDFVINTEDILKIDELIFKQIFLVSFPNENSEAYVKTSGLIVERQSSGRCFGVI